jgi:7-cyano-7-deazaguanosine (preQ0) biosynthesis protein QueE
VATTLAISEIYGPTLQGEGPSLGHACAFLRTAGCNQHCSWCDTPFTWNWKLFDPKVEVHKLSVEEVIERLLKVLPKKNPMLVISGGEPLLQQGVLAEVMERLHDSVPYEDDLVIEVETAGTIAPELEFDYWVDAYNVSLKLEHSGNELDLRYRPEVIDDLHASEKVQAWKFVAQQPSDLVEIDELVDKHGLFPVYVMPEGRTREELEAHTASLVIPVIERGWRLTPRLHIQLWGNERGH